MRFEAQVNTVCAHSIRGDTLHVEQSEIVSFAERSMPDCKSLVPRKRITRSIGAFRMMAINPLPSITSAARPLISEFLSAS